jgi:hypothetical protein
MDPFVRNNTASLLLCFGLLGFISSLILAVCAFFGYIAWWIALSIFLISLTVYLLGNKWNR